jgi:YbbR domain-containing protein
MPQRTQESFARRALERARRYLFEDAKLKLLALLIVTVIWLSVAGQTRTGAPIKIHNLDVTLEKVPPNLAVIGTDPPQVNVTIEGPDDQLRELRFEVATQSSDLGAFADLSNLKEGLQKAPLTVRGLPDGLRLAKVEPDKVQVTLDLIRSKDVPVEPRFAGSLPDGFKLAGARVDPDVVTVTGPESVVNKIEKVTTTTVSLNNQTKTFHEDVDVIATDNVFVPTRPTVHVTIEENVGTKSFTVPVAVEGGAGGEPESQTVTVTLKGPLSVLGAIKPTDITATIAPVGSAARQSLAPKIDVAEPNGPLVTVDHFVPDRVRWHR